jgi:hypothetical protein
MKEQNISTKLSVNIATYKPRVDNGSLRKTINSLKNQCEIINVFFNGYTEVPKGFEDINGVATGEDFKDNAKFYFVQFFEGYYLSCDDDLIYPCDYVDKTIDAIDEFNCAITYHGRKLKGLDKNYYSGHQYFACLGELKYNFKIDVCGSGVLGFHTSMIDVKDLYKHEIQKASDLIFSLECAKQKVKIGIIAHNVGWINHTHNEETIWGSEYKTPTIQNQLANEIWKLKYPNH